MKIILIRHGKTQGNLEKRYIGTTDEHLCPEGQTEILAKKYPQADLLFCSPLMRCRETAQLIYPEQDHAIIDDFRECDFGDFENRNHLELADNNDYQAWVDSCGMLPFPNGESRQAFSSRCCTAFKQLLLENHNKDIACVVHGGTIMAILEQFATPKQDYYFYQLKNGEAYICEYNNNTLTILQKE